MAKIPISRKEFEKGWTRARSIYFVVAGTKNNAHRLLLFYAVENGLKALIMKREMLRDGTEGFDDEVHDINKLLARVKASTRLHLPVSVSLQDSGLGQRSCSTGQINQMWRYGCMALTPTDDAIEAQLLAIADWIEENL